MYQVLQVCTNFSFSLIDNFLSRSVGQALFRRRRKVAETSAQSRGDVVTICSQAPWSLVGVGDVSLVENTLRLPLDPPNFGSPSDFLKNRGKPFQKNGAQTLKARQPFELVEKRLSCFSKRRRSGLADLRYGLHDVCNLINSDKYSGALLSKILKTMSRILIVIKERIGN